MKISKIVTLISLALFFTNSWAQCRVYFDGPHYAQKLAIKTLSGQALTVVDEESIADHVIKVESGKIGGDDTGALFAFAYLKTLRGECIEFNQWKTLCHAKVMHEREAVRCSISALDQIYN